MILLWRPRPTLYDSDISATLSSGTIKKLPVISVIVTLTGGDKHGSE
jgi:hypothetical protein